VTQSRDTILALPPAIAILCRGWQSGIISVAEGPGVSFTQVMRCDIQLAEGWQQRERAGGGDDDAVLSSSGKTLYLAR
jgi:hypothetical protein